MNRVSILAEVTTSYRYRDSLHAAIVSALREAGAAEADILGEKAKPWTFSPIQQVQGGELRLKGAIVSTSDETLGRIVGRIKPEAVAWNSTNGDRIDFGAGRVTSFRNPVPREGGEMQVYFASPFVMSTRLVDGKKQWIEDLKGVDISAAFSASLTRRHGRDIKIEANMDDFTMNIASKRNAIVAVRQSGQRKITFPGFYGNIQIKGTKEDLEAAYFAGLGEKTRYGFGMVAPAK